MTRVVEMLSRGEDVAPALAHAAGVLEVDGLALALSSESGHNELLCSTHETAQGVKDRTQHADDHWRAD